MPRHRKIVPRFPEWVEHETDLCLQSTAADAYTAQSLAITAGAPHSKRCSQLMRAGEKSIAIMANAKASKGKRCSEGDRAARKFWEAKVCIRQER